MDSLSIKTTPCLSLLSRSVSFAILFAACVSPALAEVDFVREVKPLLARRCFACHGPDDGEGGLHLHERDAALAELDSGSHAIVPGDADASELLARVMADDESIRMPPEGEPLSEREVGILREWIEQGADWRRHWAFVPPEKHEPPQPQGTDWVRNPIDAFVLDQLESNGFSPVPQASKRDLARRAYFTAIGLPPTLEQLERFLHDDRPDAYESLVGELLASPHYGEQWARHWLDLVRYAETNSFERDGAKPNAWKYRDYVIRSFNDDKPYDQFVREQLAGDELDEVTPETITATGYYRLGIWDDEPADELQAKYDEWDDILSTTGQAFLGLTVGCARCHDHKIDPFPQSDYYGLLSFFADVTPYALKHRRDPEFNSLWDMSPPEQRERRKSLRSSSRELFEQMIALEQTGIRRMSAPDQRKTEGPGRRKVLREKLPSVLNAEEWRDYSTLKQERKLLEDQLDAMGPANMVLAVARCDPRPPTMHVMLRGSPHAPGDPVEPHFPEICGGGSPELPPVPEDARSSGRRRVLADWITSPDNLLTARVIVNRVWQHHFGRGIVRSASNFGEMGTPPTHPKLLDWLALWLIDHDWQLKPLHRLIMTSATYRMSSQVNEEALAADPTNDLLWRFDMKRLSAEELRDAALVVTGRFNPQMYGKSFYSDISDEALATQSRPGQGWGTSSAEQRSRRSVYIHVKRSLVTPLLATFDFPDTDVACEARFATTQPGQALTMINGKFMNEQAGYLRDKILATMPNQPSSQVSQAIKLVLGRDATDKEVKEGLQLIGKMTDQHGLQPAEALRYWCLAVLNLNEFLYLD